MEFLHMSKELNDLIDRAPNEEEFPCRCGQEYRELKEAWEGRGPTEWRCDLAWGNHVWEIQS